MYKPIKLRYLIAELSSITKSYPEIIQIKTHKKEVDD